MGLVEPDWLAKKPPYTLLFAWMDACSPAVSPSLTQHACTLRIAGTRCASNRGESYHGHRSDDLTLEKVSPGQFILSS